MLLGIPRSEHRYGAFVDRAHDARAQMVSALFTAGAAAIGSGVQGTVLRLWTGARRTMNGIAQARRRRAAIRDLERLDDRMLSDIGLPRSQIDYAVEQLLAAERTERDSAARHAGVDKNAKPDAAMRNEDDSFRRAA